MSASLMEWQDLCYGFDDQPTFLGPMSGSLWRGKLYGILGPNGAGKSTLIRLFVGLFPPRSGTIRLGDRELQDWSQLDRSRRIAYVPQRIYVPPGLTAREAVLLGRFPHRGQSWFETHDDHRIALECLRMMEVEKFANRLLDTLSGGEAQCVHLAAAVAQQTELLFLDEPTSALDLYHQHLIYEKLAALAHSRDLCVVIVTHDLNLAYHYCDHVMVMKAGQLVTSGPPSKMLTAELLRQVYDVRAELIPSTGGVPWLVSVGRADSPLRTSPGIKERS